MGRASSPSLSTPAAMAPEDTSATSIPFSRAAKTWVASAFTRSGLRRPDSSVMVAVPTFMTILRTLSIFALRALLFAVAGRFCNRCLPALREVLESPSRDLDIIARRCSRARQCVLDPDGPELAGKESPGLVIVPVRHADQPLDARPDNHETAVLRGDGHRLVFDRRLVSNTLSREHPFFASPVDPI